MRYEWDETKYLRNLKKHGIRFEDALLVFSDLNALEMFDISLVEEERIVMIGLNPHKGVLVIVYSEPRENVTRIISARKATLMEEKQYEKGI